MCNRIIRDKPISRSKNTLETVVYLVCIFYICLQDPSRMKGYPHGKDVRQNNYVSHMCLTNHIETIISSDHIYLSRSIVHTNIKSHLNMSEWFHHETVV
jgi:hypothetical protein